MLKNFQNKKNKLSKRPLTNIYLTIFSFFFSFYHFLSMEKNGIRALFLKFCQFILSYFDYIFCCNMVILTTDINELRICLGLLSNYTIGLLCPFHTVHEVLAKCFSWNSRVQSARQFTRASRRSLARDTCETYSVTLLWKMCGRMSHVRHVRLACEVCVKCLSLRSRARHFTRTSLTMLEGPYDLIHLFTNIVMCFFC